MSVSEQEVKKIAELAHLEISEAEVQVQTERFNGILNYIDKMQEVPTDAKMASIPGFDEPTPMREDIVRDSLGFEKGLKNPPQSFENFVVVPKVVEG